MTKNLGWKLLVIIGTLLVFLFGIFGMPNNWSQGALAAMTNRIHLGLDLKGGTHLILQVQVNDAINADSDRAIERMKDDDPAAQSKLSAIKAYVSTEGVPAGPLMKMAKLGAVIDQWMRQTDVAISADSSKLCVAHAGTHLP